MPASPAGGSVIAIPLAPDEVEKMIHGTLPNYGWLLKMDVENNDKHDYDSSSATTPTDRPKLVIQYATAASITPEWENRVYNYSFYMVHTVINDKRGNGYDYDSSDGNQVYRVEGGKYYYQNFNALNQLTWVELWKDQITLAAWCFYYDGDGNLVRQEYYETSYDGNTIVKVTSYFAGGTYELDQTGVVQPDESILITGTTTTRKYYSFAGQMVAMSECGPQGCGSGLQYFLTDHLDSVVAVANASGTLVSQQPWAFAQDRRYMPFGEVRTDVGTITQTDFGYTGQRNVDAQGNSYKLGLMDYKARFYYPNLHHFVSPDSIAPDLYDPQSLNPYAYARNNPIRYNDPSGHCISGAVADTIFCVYAAAMAVGAVVDASINAYSQYKDTGHIDWGEVGTHAVEGALIAGAPFMALAAAPVVLNQAGNTLSWGGANAGSTTLFNAGQGLNDYSTNLTDWLNSPTILSNQALSTNAIGQQAQNAVGNELPNVTNAQTRVQGGARVYDGYFTDDPDSFIEVKTSTRGTVYANSFNRHQADFDGEWATATGKPPSWIFVNANPSRPLMQYLQDRGLPWTVLHIPE